MLFRLARVIEKQSICTQRVAWWIVRPLNSWQLSTEWLSLKCVYIILFITYFMCNASFSVTDIFSFIDFCSPLMNKQELKFDRKLIGPSLTCFVQWISAQSELLSTLEPHYCVSLFDYPCSCNCPLSACNCEVCVVSCV